MTNHEMSSLRRTVTPYIGQSVIIAGVILLLVYVALKRGQWDLLWTAALIGVLFMSYIFFFGMKYRVSWNEKGLKMKASGGSMRSIPFDDITEVRCETASSDEFLSQARPFRRLVVIGSSRDPSGQIDISLRHFQAQDVHKLMEVIREQRPDLTLPSSQSLSSRRHSG